MCAWKTDGVGPVHALKKNGKVREQTASGEWGTQEGRSTCWQIVGMMYHSLDLETNEINLGKFQGSSQTLGVYLSSEFIHLFICSSS